MDLTIFCYLACCVLRRVYLAEIVQQAMRIEMQRLLLWEDMRCEVRNA